MRRQFLLCSLIAALTCVAGQAKIAVRLGSSLSSPQPLGTPIVFKATAVDSNPNPVTYRFEIATAPSGAYSLLQDYSTEPAFSWAETFVEGSYQMRVTARDYLSGESAQAVSQPFQITSLVTGTTPVVTATANPLVALLSAPTCPAGTQMRVAFQRLGAKVTSYTDYRACHAGSMNFYVAGAGRKLRLSAFRTATNQR